ELTAPPTQARDARPLRRWLGPLAALLVFAGVVLLLHRQLSRLHIRSIFEHLHAIPRRQVLAALAFTAASYWLLSTYEVLALRSLSNAASMLRLHHSWSLLVGTALLGAVGAYALWASLARGKLEIRGWALRAPGAAIGLTQILLGVADLSLSSAVLWSLLPAGAHIGFVSFLGI